MRRAGGADLGTSGIFFDHRAGLGQKLVAGWLPFDAAGVGSIERYAGTVVSELDLGKCDTLRHEIKTLSQTTQVLALLLRCF